MRRPAKIAVQAAGSSRSISGEDQLAYEMEIRGVPDRVKIRSPWAVALLPIVTLGIYHLVWWFKINRELRDFGRARGFDLGDNPTLSMLALFPGSIVVVPALVSYWRGVRRVQGASRLAGREPVNGWIALILYLLLAPGFWAYLQVSLNELWRQEAEALPGQEPPPVSTSHMPPPLPPEERTSAAAGTGPSGSPGASSGA